MNNTNTDVKDIVCDFDNLYNALLKCKRNVLWKDSIAGYYKNALANCYKLRQQLLNDTYTIDPYTKFTVYEPKERAIVSTRIKDRVFQRSLCDNYLYHEMTKSFIYDNCACQENKGTLFARNRLKCHLQRFYRKHGTNGYVLKCDLSNFFGSTSHKVAIEAVDKRVPDDWAVNKVIQIIRSFDGDVGMGLGSQVTQLIQLAVLDDLDHYIKEQLHIKYYIRYMDDFILIHPDKEYLKYCKAEIEKRINDLGLILNHKKTQLFSLAQPIKFLGFTFRLTNTGKVVCKLIPNKVSHERRKLKKLVSRAKQGLMTKEQVDECFKSWKAHASFGDTYTLISNMETYYKNLWR